MAPIITNNYYVRVLGGEATYRLPLGNVTGAHLDSALRTVQTFDLVMTLETLTVEGPIVVRRGLGWQKNRVLALNKRREDKVRQRPGWCDGGSGCGCEAPSNQSPPSMPPPLPQERKSPLPPPSASDLALLRQLNQLDSALYARTAEIAALDFEFFREVQGCSARCALDVRARVCSRGAPP